MSFFKRNSEYGSLSDNESDNESVSDNETVIENSFLVSPDAYTHHKEVKVDSVPFLYTPKLTSCVGIAYCLKDEKGQPIKIGLYHSNAA